ncbi:hypothetical protein DY000_02007691 [Brassica cretica]|uniref:Uncharacterized protein n=1 Tax=Brassica cretica TaxID=69181 RepID=A0ABQ7BZC5_BRACR|nr:hypothetical protein DY000_02007691 [Brassica cretica]
MAVDEHDELPEATQREAELQRQIDDLQGQVTGLHRTREETNPELSLEFQILKEKLNEHSKKLEQSAEKLNQLESENLTLRDENQAHNAASNKKRRFRTQHESSILDHPVLNLICHARTAREMLTADLGD